MTTIISLSFTKVIHRKFSKKLLTSSKELSIDTIKDTLFILFPSEIYEIILFYIHKHFVNDKFFYSLTYNDIPKY